MPATPLHPRVLLVQDDASIRHFVQTALAEHPLELLACSSLEDARRAIYQRPPALVLLDMLLPDGSGLELLIDAPLRGAAGAAHWVVFSSGLPVELSKRLPALQVAQVLQQPIGMPALLDCVDEALRAASEDGGPAAQAQAIAHYFEGDAVLFFQMRERAQAQFETDLRVADEALAQSDFAALRRVVHSLKTVLRMVGRPAAGDIAQSLEAVLMAGQTERAKALWAQLRARMRPPRAP
jgi:DNA-binding response OmpR family regulator